MNNKCVISGGFGDSINQIAKAICLRDQKHCNHITYIRDTIDEGILDNAKPLTRNYAEWVKAICEHNGFEFSLLAGDQKKLCESLGQSPENIILGPNMNYEHRVWEPQREMYIGIRPHELEFIPPPTFHFPHDYQLGLQRIGIQVRFGSEYPTKVPNASWNSVEELVSLIKRIKEMAPKYEILLFGETKQNIDALRGRTKYLINSFIIDQFKEILTCKKMIGFAGYCANVCGLNKIPMMRMFWDKLEYELQTPKWVYKTITHFNHENMLDSLGGFLNG